MNEDSAYQYIITLIYDRAGIRLNDGKHELIKARLGKRMRFHGYTELTTYCDFLKNKADEAEMTEVVDCLTTNFTHFLREEDHLKFLTNQALPSLYSKPGKFKVWCAACATGEEPYSIAFYLFEHYPPSAGWDWSILATDISTKALGKAKAAVYAAEKLEALPVLWRQAYFQKGQNNCDGYYKVKSQVSNRVIFKQINLLKPYDFSEQFAVVFCRNVMIYFDRPTQEGLINQLSHQLMPKGYLIVGHAESLTGLNVGLNRLNPSVYRKG